MIIAFAGGMGTGKTTAAGLIKKASDSSIILNFAAQVKNIARDCFGWDGIKDEKGRRLLQIIGTEAGRAYNPDIWVEDMRKRAKICKDLGYLNIIIDDLRFDNEADFIHSLGGYIILIKRDTKIKSSHASEQGIKYYDDIIVNNSDLSDLEQLVSMSLNKICIQEASKLKRELFPGGI